MIDLRSDTVTKPTEKMRKAMVEAEVGDDVYGDDPTVNSLQELAADMVGKEAALYVPSGTMGNQAAIMTHTQIGDEIILEENSHIFLFEGGGAARLSGCQTRTLSGKSGIMSTEDIRAAIRGDNIHYPKSSLLCLENTHNRAGGAVVSPKDTRELAEVAHKQGLKVHLDGARIFNAATAAGVCVTELTEPVDSVQFCLSKGLAAPVGSIVAGSEEFIDGCLRARKVLGGGMRQAGILAAAGIIALEVMSKRLDEDHQTARKLAESLANMKPFSINPDAVETNIVAFDVDPDRLNADSFLEELESAGVLANTIGPQQIRMVTHYQIGPDDVETAVDTIHQTIQQMD